MSLMLVRKAAEAEISDDIHMMRIMQLIAVSGRWKGTKEIKGITKLAKMDFLLRYPNCLKIALEKMGKKLSDFKIEILEHELNTIESKMIRFRYGPWDGRYRRWISLLRAKELICLYTKGRTVIVETTKLGSEFIEEVSQSPILKEHYLRTVAVVKTFGRFSATGLMDFIYETFS